MYRGHVACATVLVVLLSSSIPFAQGQASPPPQAKPSPPPQVAQQPPQPPRLRPPTRADVLRGEYGQYRANNDLLYYHLDIRVDPDKKFISGKNTIRFKMLEDDTRIQIDLYANLNVDRITLGTRDLQYTREINAVSIM